MSDLNNRPTIVTKDSRGRANSRVYPFAPTAISATSFATAQELWECPQGETDEFARVNLSNVTNNNQNVSFYVVPVGDTLADKHIVLGAMQIDAHTVQTFESPIMLATGWKLFAFADAANAIRVSGWIKAHL